MIRIVASLAVSLSTMVTTSAFAQTPGNIKDGDKLKIEVVTYGTRGREIIAENTQSLDSSISMQDKTYTWTSPLATTVYNKGNHAAIERTMPNGNKTVIAENMRHSWFPVNRDFSKLSPGSIAIQNPQCGNGVFKYEASAKPVKVKLSVAGQSQELDMQEVTLDGKWQLGSCGMGNQTLRYVYSPQLDFIVESDQKNYQPNGILNRGQNIKVTSVN